MKGPKAVKRVILLIPPIRHFVHEKAELGAALIQRTNELNQLRDSTDKISAELNLLKGIVPGATEIRWPVFKKDIVAAVTAKRLVYIGNKKPPYKLNWVLPPMGSTSGGHTSLFRAMKHLESQGHSNTIYFYDALGLSNLAELKATLRDHYPKIKAKVFYNATSMEDCDAIFATNWFTAYPVLNYAKPVMKYYFVQDFEPMFEAAGSYATLAESTYSFGFNGITIGDWLKEKLSNEFNMTCDSLPFGVNTKEYYLKNIAPRKDILFYARPVTARRGFEMGVLALELFHKNNPETTIHILGWDVGNFKLPFPYVNHAVLNTAELNDLYNKCAAGLVLSFTNMSLLPLEMLSSGCIPVINDAHHTRLVPYDKFVGYGAPNPQTLAVQLEKSIHKAQHSDVTKLAEVAQKYSWESSFDIIEKVLIRDLQRN